MKLSKRWNVSAFINGFGNLPSEYLSMKNEVERVQFLAENFGSIWIDVLRARQSVQRAALPFGWVSRIVSFVINFIDWRA